MRQSIVNQLLAALATLNQCIKNCPDSEWNEAHGDAPFSQVIFHTLFYQDYYLSENEETFKAQQFHKEHMDMFRDYEELINRKAKETYTRDEIELYLDFCYQKIKSLFADMNDNDFLKETKHRNMTYLELAIYCARHVQHHAAQLGLRLQLLSGNELEWISRGWM